MDGVLFSAAMSIDQHLKDKKEAHGPSKFRTKNAIEEDEEKIFGRSLIPRLKRILRQDRGCVRLQIEHVFFLVESSILEEQQKNSQTMLVRK